MTNLIILTLSRTFQIANLSRNIWIWYSFDYFLSFLCFRFHFLSDLSYFEISFSIYISKQIFINVGGIYSLIQQKLCYKLDILEESSMSSKCVYLTLFWVMAMKIEKMHNVAKTLLKLNLNSSIFKCSRESYWTFHSRPDYIFKKYIAQSLRIWYEHILINKLASLCKL